MEPRTRSAKPSREYRVDLRTAVYLEALASVVGASRVEVFREVCERGLDSLVSERAKLSGLSTSGYLAWAASHWRESRRLLSAGAD